MVFSCKFVLACSDVIFVLTICHSPSEMKYFETSCFCCLTSFLYEKADRHSSAAKERTKGGNAQQQPLRVSALFFSCRLVQVLVVYI